ncbi:MAG: bifunctional glutamine-synthetase adenylyltransferase/deadenyltransferase, partial [Demequina sp.]
MSTRQITLATRLRRAGVSDVDRAQQLIEEIAQVTGVSIDDPPHAMSYLADPETALLQLLRLAEAARDSGRMGDLVALKDSRAGAKLGLLLGGSVALGDFLVRHPEFVSDFATWDDEESFADVDVRAVLLEAVGADPRDTAPVATVSGADGVAAMRIAYRRQLVRVAAHDLYSATPTDLYPRVASTLSDLAGAALEAGLAMARAQEPAHVATRLAIIGMGKCGARELNYVSDV